MDFQKTIEKLESIKQKAPKIERNTLPFYQQWQKGVAMAMKGQLEASSEQHTTAYIEGLLDAICFLEMEYFNRLYGNLSPDEPNI